MKRQSTQKAGIRTPVLVFIGAPAGVLALVLWFWPSLLLPPVQVVAVCERASTGARVMATVGAQFQSMVMRASDLPQSREIRITATGERNPASGGTIVFVADLVNEADLPLPASGYRPGPGWTRWEHGGRWVAGPPEGQPAALIWSGVVSGPVVVSMPYSVHGGNVHLQCDDGPTRTIDLYAPEESWHVEKLYPTESRARHVARLPFSCSGLSLNVDSGSATFSRIQVLWGEHVLFDRHEPVVVGQSPVDVGMPAVRGWRIRLLAVTSIVRLIGKAIVAAVIAFLVGLPIVFVLFGRLSLLERYTTALMVGTTLPTVVSITLTHAGCTGKQAFWIPVLLLASVSIGLILAALVRRSDVLRGLVPCRAEIRTLLTLTALSTVLAPLAFYPALGYPRWYVGQSYTDTFYYFNTAAAFENHSLDILRKPEWWKIDQIEPLVTAELDFTDRSGDFLALLNAAELGRTDTRSAFPQLHLNWWFLLPFISCCLFTRLGCGVTAVWLGVLLMSGSANLLSIFTQDYLAQFLFVNVLLHVILATTIYLSEREQSPLRPAQHAGFVLLLAILMAACLGTYPTQFLLPAALGLVMGWQSIRQRSPRPFALLVTIGVTTALVSNVGLLPLLNASRDATPYLKGLNEIARWFVFPFYNHISQFLLITFGLSDWVQHSKLAPQILLEVAGHAGPPLLIGLNVLKKLRRLVLFISVVLVLLGALACAARSAAGRLVSACLALYIVVAVLFAWKQQLYPYGKQLITCGVLFLLCLVVGLDVLLRSRRRTVRQATVCFAVIFLIYNARSIWFDNSIWLVSAHHPLLDQARTHVGILTEDLRELASCSFPADHHAEPPCVAIIGTYLPGAGTNGDRVMAAYVHHAFRNHKVLHDPSDAEWSRQHPDLVLVYDGSRLPAGISSTTTRILANATFTLYRTRRD